MFTANFDRTVLRINPESDVNLYRCCRDRVNRGFDLKIDSFWQAVLDQKGMDKEASIASLAPSNELPPIIFDIRGDDPMNPSEVVLALKESDETYSFPAAGFWQYNHPEYQSPRFVHCQ